MSLLEFNWAAGFFDGEGHTGYTKSNKSSKTSRRIQIGITQTNKFTLLRFKSSVVHGKVYGPYKNRNNKPIFKYYVEGSKAIEVIDILWPYLGPSKRAQADRAIFLYEDEAVKSHKKYKER